jgi:hypothetical protein
MSGTQSALDSAVNPLHDLCIDINSIPSIPRQANVYQRDLHLEILFTANKQLEDLVQGMLLCCSMGKLVRKGLDSSAMLAHDFDLVI